MEGEGIIEEHAFNFRINQRLEIMLHNQKKVEHYPSRIEELTPQYMAVAMPMSKGHPIILNAGEIFHGKTTAGGAVYQFTSVFKEKKLKPLPLWVVSLPYDIRKIQQRAFVRIAIAIPLELQIIDEQEEQQEPYYVSTKDLSGGGLRIICQQPLPIGTKVLVKIQLPEMGEVQTNGEVSRNEQPQADRQLFWIGIKFLDIKEFSREKIIKFIFKKQLEQRQKGV